MSGGIPGGFSEKSVEDFMKDFLEKSRKESQLKNMKEAFEKESDFFNFPKELLGHFFDSIPWELRCSNYGKIYE